MENRSGANRSRSQSNPSQASPSPSATPRGYLRLLPFFAKVFALVIAAVSGVYAVLAYYSSIAALRQSVEANKLTLLIYCDSNNVTDRACDEVRHDLSTEEAVEEVFGDGDLKDTGDGDSSTAEGQQQPSPTSSQATGVNDGSNTESGSSGAGSRQIAVPSPTTFVKSVISSQGKGGSDHPDPAATPSPSLTPTTSFHTPTSHIEQGEQSEYPSGQSSWFETCTKLNRRVRAAKTKFVSVCYPPQHRGPTSIALHYSIDPTSPLSSSCSELQEQYREARLAARYYSCESLDPDAALQWQTATATTTAHSYGPTSLTNVPEVEAGASSNATVAPGVDHDRTANSVGTVTLLTCIALFGLVMLLYILVRRSMRFRRYDKDISCYQKHEPYHD